jgi:hypothetical protein
MLELVPVLPHSSNSDKKIALAVQPTPFDARTLPKAYPRHQGVDRLSIMTWPKPEQLTWVAPSIRRAKS